MTSPGGNAKIEGTLNMAPAILLIIFVVSDLKQSQLSQLVQEMRQRSGLTQTEFAAKIGVSYYSVNRWENQRTMPVALALKRIEDVLREMGDRGADLLEQYFPAENQE